MSYILDALKKSEEERRLGETPGIDSAPINFSNEGLDRPIRWQIGLMIALIVVVVSAIFIYFDKRFESLELVDVSTTVSQTPRTAQVNNDKVKAVAKVLSVPIEGLDKSRDDEVKADILEPLLSSGNVLDDQPLDSEPVEDDKLEKYTQEFTKQGDEIIRPNADRRVALQKAIDTKKRSVDRDKLYYKAYFDQDKAVEAQVQGSQNDQGNIIDDLSKEKLVQRSELKEPNYDHVEGISSLSNALKEQLPTIKISTHIYANAADFCSATINGIRYKNGALIGETLVLEKITDDGVILSFNGTLFRMSALQEWKP